MPITPLIVLIIFFILWTHETLIKSQPALNQKMSGGDDPDKTASDKLAQAIADYLNDKSK
jgi:hypothetical protein